MSSLQMKMNVLYFITVGYIPDWKILKMDF